MARPHGSSIQSPPAIESAESDTYFRFMDLPPELRVMIYTFAFAAHRQMLHRLGLPSITRISRLIRIESLPIFFSEMTFALIISLTFRGAAAILSATGKEQKKLQRKRAAQNPGWGSLGIRKVQLQTLKSAKTWTPVLFRHMEIILPRLGRIEADWEPKSGLSFLSIEGEGWNRLGPRGPRAPLKEDYDAIVQCMKKAMENVVEKEGFAGFRVYDLRKVGWAGERVQMD